MNVHINKRGLMRCGLFVVEWILFVSLSILMKINMLEAMMFSAMYFVIITFYNHYTFSPILIWQEITQMLQAHGLYMILSIIIVLYLRQSLLIKLLVHTAIMYCVTVLVSRTFRRFGRRRCATHLLIMGAGKGAEQMWEIFKSNRFMFVEPLAYVDLEPLTGKKRTEKKGIKEKIISMGELENFLKEHVIDEVFVVDDALTAEQLEQIVENLQNKVPVIKYKPVMKMVQPYNTKVEDYDGNLFISVTDAKRREFDRVLKKCIDIVAGVVGCILLIPLTVYVKIKTVKSGDYESIFFTQERIGKDGKIFKMYKYRSMLPNAEEILEDLMKNDPQIRDEYLKNKKLDPDPRVTLFGDFLRKTSLDEMPQFINVLKGEMSLIGPRPYLAREIEDMGKYYNTVIKSMPGITGMWQANGRSDVGFSERCKLDAYYYDNWSIWLDIIIIVKTIKVVLQKEGAV